MKKKVGFIGLGMMGKPMAKNVAKAGFPLTVFDKVTEPVAELVQAGATAAGSSKEVAQASEVIIVMVADGAQVQDVVLGDNGVIEGIKEGSTVIIMSTIEPTVVKAVADALLRKGVKVIDAPVTKGQPAAIQGTLGIMVGGDEAVMEDCREILQTMGDIVHCGDIGTGEVAKIVNNYICLNSSLLIAEGIVLGVKCGMKPDRLLDVLASGSAESWMLHYWGSKALKGDFNPGFYLDLTIKDITLALATAKELKVPVPVGALCQQLLQAGSAAGKGKQDFTAMLTMLEELAGVEVRSESKG